MSAIARVGVVGCGLMGSGLAEVSARAGCDVRVVVSREASVAAGRERVTRSLDTAVARGRLTASERTATLERISFSADLKDLADREFVIESVIEDEAVKLELFATLDAVVEDPEAVLASNTSSVPIMKLARVTSRPAQVIGTHFFNPVPVLALVEVGCSLLTSERTYERTEAFMSGQLGKEVVRSQDRPGFVVNALLVPYLLGAIRMVEAGHARAEDIDKGMSLGCAHPMGPLQLADLVGLDTLADVASGLYAEYKDTSYAPPPLLSRMVEGGLLGRKTGRGFYSYP
ncbi:3-hydroxyacyl-CoA dehydrogenase [Streptomyces sp. 3211.6]|uniref:3-hydroxybutyryl-CoA dehydrogenase n=1 Tax=Streptomyces TaxID=1883 RepID=UPI0009A4BFBE|nr:MULTISPECIES: 3-hydroxybutyryl-CoA dehydrogenase [Streptomyces]RKT04570.1 3-hydroxyacyl-CoA dehydrogenase [Streptomyces sp. 3211.6]RPF40445.1 3-hydroxyacyl-CoA dehydrogenase [Streptomyces sp. Ag109_G2-6]